MKQRQLFCAAAVAALWLTAAPGAADNTLDSQTVGDNNQVTIQQIGTSLIATIRSGNDIGDMGNVVEVTQTSTGNEAIIVQMESLANVVVTQSGSGNFGQLSQAHSDVATLLQTGNNNVADVLQLGVASLGSTGGNEASIAQPGGDNTGVIIQVTERPCDADGSCVDDALGNAASIDQTGSGDHAQILQAGEVNHSTAIQDVTSQSNSTFVVQEGTGNIANVFHSDLSAGNVALIGQLGDTNLAEVLQSGASALNFAALLQTGIANSARLSLHI